MCVKEGNRSSIDRQSRLSLVRNGRRNAKFMVKISVFVAVNDSYKFYRDGDKTRRLTYSEKSRVHSINKKKLKKTAFAIINTGI